MESSGFELHKFEELLPADYQLIECLGEGGSGTVVKAFYSPISQFVAIKFFQSASVGGQDDAERLRREAKAIAKLDHQNIVRVLHTGMAKNETPFLVYEFIEGKDLLSFFRSQSELDKAKLASAVQQICDGLEYAHTKGIVHRDVKPANIVVSDCSDDTISVKILDFGIASVDSSHEGASTSNTKTGTIKGSPQYMSPEQCKGQRVDKRTDVYSLSCVLFEILTGQPAYSGETPYELLYKHIGAPLPVPQKSFSASLNSFFERGLAKDREARYDSMSSLCAAFLPSLNTLKSKPKFAVDSRLIPIVALVVCSSAIILLTPFLSKKKVPADAIVHPSAPKIKKSLSNQVHDEIRRAESLTVRANPNEKRDCIKNLNVIIQALDSASGSRDYTPEKFICYDVISDLNTELLDKSGTEAALQQCVAISDKWAPEGKECLQSFKGYTLLAKLEWERGDKAAFAKYVQKAERIYKAIKEQKFTGKELPFNYHCMDIPNMECGLSAIQCYSALEAHELDRAEFLAKRSIKDARTVWGADIIDRPFILLTRVHLAKGDRDAARNEIINTMKALSSMNSASTKDLVAKHLFDAYDSANACNQAETFVREKIKDSNLEKLVTKTKEEIVQNHRRLFEPGAPTNENDLEDLNRLHRLGTVL